MKTLRGSQSWRDVQEKRTRAEKVIVAASIVGAIAIVLILAWLDAGPR
jgi:hypothetical protein